MTAPELLPCPFCGKVAHLRGDVCHSTAFFVGCETLGCFGNAQWDETQEEAVSNWNTRADLADAAVAAAYEAAANEARSYMEPHVANGIRALATDVHTNALEDVRRETHDSAIHGLLKEIEGHLPEFGAGDPQDKTDLIIDQTWRSFRKIALSKLSTAQEDKT